MSDINLNIEREFYEGYVPMAQLIQTALLESHNYSEAIALLSNHPVNTPCYVIVGGKLENEGTVLVRDPKGLNVSHSLSSAQWYVAQGN
jgi:hypothetical protein